MDALAERAALTWLRGGLGGPHCVLREHQLRAGLRRTDLVVVTHSYAHAWLLGADASCFDTLPKALEGIEMVTLVVAPADAPRCSRPCPPRGGWPPWTLLLAAHWSWCGRPSTGPSRDSSPSSSCSGATRSARRWVRSASR